MKEKFYSKKNCYNVLFLPGFPGGYRERELTDDLKKLGFNIYTISYYEIQDKQTFGFESSVEQINKALGKLNNLPLLIISYSYSTILVTKSMCKNMDNIMGIFFFSPIFDLKHSLQVDFLADLKIMIDKKEIIVNKNAFDLITQKNIITAIKLYKKDIQLILKKHIPLIYIFGDRDVVIKTNLVKSVVNEIQKEQNKFNQIKILKTKYGNHKLDSLYKNIHYKYIVALFAAYELKKALNRDCSIYARGSLINEQFFSDISDIDFVIMINGNFDLNDRIKLNKFKYKLSQKLDTKIDVSIASTSEFGIIDDAISVRGATFFHEIENFYLPIIISKNIRIPKIDKQKIIAGAIKANLANIHKSERALLKYQPGTDDSNFIIKHFLIGCYYDQFCKGNLIFEQQDIKMLYKKNSTTFKLLQKILEYKKANYTTITLEMLKKYLETHIQLYKEII